jgi:hypothetical protein
MLPTKPCGVRATLTIVWDVAIANFVCFTDKKMNAASCSDGGPKPEKIVDDQSGDRDGKGGYAAFGDGGCPIGNGS